ncbi:hypothetical protein CANINC_004572 [Pichia inconspicua]|uniref:LisH domain-containing protein n=1 Tax=Pichia inconspicua TaxID=52247 RepID=A0A4T0WVN0_9ASCO|nr:hypothetical protein CANINC_004572 [[Candida] inconspicua]
MSISTNEVNYLVWRYLQEAGLELSAFALNDETHVSSLDKDYAQHVPLGSLVELIQKGILYTKMKELVSLSETDTLTQDQVINMNLNFLQSVHELNGNVKREIIHESQTSNDSIKDEGTNKNESSNSTEQSKDDDFIKVIKESLTFDSSLSVSFNPINSDIVAWTQKGNTISSIYSLSNSKRIDLPLSTTTKETLLISWSPDGSQLATASENGELNIWSSNGVLKSVLAMHHWPIVSIQWSPNGKYLISLDIRNISIVWDVENQTMIIHLDKEKWISLDKFNIPITDISKNFGSQTCWIDNSKFITPGPNFTLLVNQITEDLQHKFIGVLIGHKDAICTLKYNDTLKLLVSASEDGEIRIFKGNSANSLQILSGHSLAVTFADFVNIDDDWYLLSTSLDGSIRLWNFLENETVSIACADEGQAIINAAVHINDKTHKIVLATSDSQGTLTLWQISTLIKPYAIYQHTPESYSSELSFNNTGDKLAVCYNSGQSVIIDV